MKLLLALKSLFKPRVASSAAADDDAVVARILESVLRQEGYEPAMRGQRLWLPSGLALEVELLERGNLDAGSVRTATRITACHDVHFPQGLPEFQHAVEGDVAQALSAGFLAWARMDLVALEDAIRTSPERCTVIEMALPATAEVSAITRQVLLGPVVHMALHPPPDDDEHPFCACCLFVRNFEAFRSLLVSDDFQGVRLFVARDEHGTPQADCRVNGEPFQAGVDHLLDYARGWPGSGFEYRKQYVIVRPLPGE